MIPNIKLHDQIELAKGFTVGEFRKMKRARNQGDIIKLVRQRFRERYILPVESGQKHGFTLVSIGCLMIETLEAFYQGKVSTYRKSGKMFEDFFRHNKSFGLDEASAKLFYSDVRCGLLHQAETRNGWRIDRESPCVVDKDARVINATKFLSELGYCLDRYCEELGQAKWEDRIWQRLLNKLNGICRNCKRDDGKAG